MENNILEKLLILEFVDSYYRVHNKYPIAASIASGLKEKIIWDETHQHINYLLHNDLLLFDNVDKLQITDLGIKAITKYQLQVEKENELKQLEETKLRLEVNHLKKTLSDYKLTKFLAWSGFFIAIILLILELYKSLNK